MLGKISLVPLPFCSSGSIGQVLCSPRGQPASIYFLFVFNFMMNNKITIDRVIADEGEAGIMQVSHIEIESE